jgi:hypothetical protein
MDRGILTRIAAFVRAVKRTLLVYVEYHIIIASKKYSHDTKIAPDCSFIILTPASLTLAMLVDHVLSHNKI